MEVSFKGIQNAGSRSFKYDKFAWCRSVVQLTNKGGKDYSEFQDIFKKFPDPSGKGLLRIDYLAGGSPSGKIKEAFSINEKPLLVTDENLPIFEKLGKLTQKVWLERAMNVFFKAPNTIPIKRSYVNSQECRKIYLPTAKGFMAEAEIKKRICEAHEFKNVMCQFKTLNNIIQSVMEEYLA